MSPLWCYVEPGRDKRIAELEREAQRLQRKLEQAIGKFVEHYNHHRYHESLNNVTPADVFFGRHHDILSRRERIKQRTLAQRRIENLRTGMV